MSEPDATLDTVAPEFDQELSAGVRQPPRGVWATLRQLGPGLIIAGSIVGSGELIATTKTGAQEGLVLLWLILLGCVIKIFVQVELGRHAITHGQTTLDSLNQVPGRIGPVTFIVWFWLIMMLTGLAQLGGIVGGVGQSLAIALPLTGDYREAVALPPLVEVKDYLKRDAELSQMTDHNEREALAATRAFAGYARLRDQIAELGTRGEEMLDAARSGNEKRMKDLFNPWTWDDRLWALAVTLLTISLLYRGRYGVIQNVSIALVVTFTFITIGNICALQTTERWSVSADEVLRGLSFHLPEGGWTSLGTALATFGIIGVGASELLTYPYWCIEKGYARFTGRRTDESAWATRARGWMRVMHWDTMLSMLVYTIATAAFYFLGATVLHREGRDPDGMRMVTTLAAAYVPIFGEYAKWLFLAGAIAVLYSTFLVANAGNARLFVDGTKIFGLISRHSQQAHDRTLSFFCVLLPFLCVALYWSGINPVTAVLVAAQTQAIMLPMIGFGALYFRWTATDPRLKPTRLWDVCLSVSFVALLIAAVWGIYSNGLKIKQQLQLKRQSLRLEPQLRDVTPQRVVRRTGSTGSFLQSAFSSDSQWTDWTSAS